MHVMDGSLSIIEGISTAPLFLLFTSSLFNYNSENVA